MHWLVERDMGELSRSLVSLYASKQEVGSIDGQQALGSFIFVHRRYIKGLYKEDVSRKEG